MSTGPSDHRRPHPGARLCEWLEADRPTREQFSAACRLRIQQEEPALHAWLQFAPQPVVSDGPLAGIPVGVKEIIETKGLATEYGSSIYRGRVASEDAAIVQRLRQLGAQVFGTTRSTAFAFFTPTVTRNPRNPAHTPGGSSSGSAAAVAAGMVPFALGTQTAGSVLRPASFCGVTGFKPSFGLLPMEGVYPFAPSLDTLGFFTTTAADMAALWSVLGLSVARNPGSMTSDPSPAPTGRTDRAVEERELPAGEADDEIFGFVDPLPVVEPAMAAAFTRTVARLREAGFRLQPIDLREMQATLEAAVRTVMQFEGARVHERHWREHPAQLGALADLVRIGLEMPVANYEKARRDIASWKARMAEQFHVTPVILTPAALGPAPAGLAATGDPRMNAPWTALGTPALSIPMPEPGPMPLGLQLTADHGQDERLLRAALRLAEAMVSLFLLSS